jgi:hypothetical protein
MVEGSEHWYDPSSGAVILNETEVTDSAVLDSLAQQSPEMAAIARWAGSSTRSGHSSLFERDRYVTPNNIFDQMNTAFGAVQHDDIVAGVGEMTENMALGWLGFDADSEDEADVFAQMAEDVDLDSRIREMWRDRYTISQGYVAVNWGTKNYKVRGVTSDGNKKRKEYNVVCPTGISILDPLKVVPVGNFMFGQERLAYYANRGEVEMIDAVLAGENSTDLVTSSLIEGKYEAPESERPFLSENEIDSSRLFLFKPEAVFRHYDTKPAYERFAYIRMKSVFEILDLKHQLRAVDRSVLMGASNFIILVKKGSDTRPAKSAEIEGLQSQVRTIARVPVIVGDHRLSIEIITPKSDNTVKPERYNTLDARLTARLTGILQTGNYAAGASGDDSLKLAKMIARSLEANRASLIRTIRKHILLPMLRRNADVLESQDVTMHFHPKRIALDFDQAIATMLQDLRDRGDLSRESHLDELGYDQEQEAKKKVREKENGFDEIFKPTFVPFSQNAPDDEDKEDEEEEKPAEDPKQAGRRKGGTKNGGGAGPGSGKPPAGKPRDEKKNQRGRTS